jgi:hypothetical protein
MVQSWENFMSPDGGAYTNDSIFTGMKGLALGLGVDFAAPMLLNSLEKREGRVLRDTLRNRNLRILSGIGENPTFSPFEKIKQRMIQEKRGAISASVFKQQQGSLIKNKYTGLRSLARGVSWAALAITAADMVESAMTPGLDRKTVERDEQAVYGSGGTFLDSSQAYTQRKRALLAIHESQLGIRGILSQEASGFHK